MASSKSVVMAALVANGLIAITKFIGYLLTGSPSMLSETYHSISDTGNQVLLLAGISYGTTNPTEHHPYGRGKSRFFFAFLVSVLLFGVAGIKSVQHGYHAIQNTLHGTTHTGGTDIIIQGINLTQIVPFDVFWINVGVLLLAFSFESYAMHKATLGIKAIQNENGYNGIIETFRETKNVTTLTAFTEDFIALVGIVLAFIGIVASRYLGNPIYDAVTALIIGVLLMGAAVALAWENKRLLLGEGMSKSDEQAIENTITDFTDVIDVFDLRTAYFGPDTVLVTVRVEMQDSLDSDEIEALNQEIKTQLKELNPDIEIVYIESSTNLHK